MAGPTIEAIWKLSWLSAIADGRRSAGTRRGMADDARRLVDRGQPGRQRRRRRTGPGPAARRHSARTTSTRLQAARPDLGRHQQPAPIDRIGERAGAEREQQDRDELEERQRGDREGRPGQDVDLVRQGDAGDLVADAVDDLAGPQPAVVAVEAERRRVEEEAADASIHPVSRGHGRRRPGSSMVRTSVWPCVAKPALAREDAGDDLVGHAARRSRRSWTSVVPSAISPMRPKTAARIAGPAGIRRRRSSEARSRTSPSASAPLGPSAPRRPRRRSPRSGAAGDGAPGPRRPSLATTA